MKRLTHILNESRLLLLEYDLQKTIKQHGEKALNVALSRSDEMDSYLRDVQGLHGGHMKNDTGKSNKHAAMHELMSQFEEADPTPQKKYVQHIARIYGQGGFNRHEDVFSRGKAAIADFHDLSTRKILPADKRDMGKYKSLSDIEDVVDSHKEQVSGKQGDKAYHEKMKAQADIKEQGTYTHIIPHTKEASQHFGKGTRWCTSAENDNMHDHYSANGPLHILVPKEPKYPGEKYQYHYSTSQLMNEKDEAKGSTGHNDIDTFIHDYRSSADNGHLMGKLGFDHPEGSVRRKTLHRHWNSATSEDLGKVLDKGLYGSYDEDRMSEDDPEMGSSPLDHPKITEDHITKVLDNPSWDIRATALSSSKFNDSHIDKVIADTDPSKVREDHNAGEMRSEVFRKTKNLKHLESAFKTLDTKNHDSDALEGMSFNKNLPEHMLNDMIKHKDIGVYAVQNPNASDNALNWAKEYHENKGARDNAKYWLGIRKQREGVARAKASQSQIKWHGK